MKLHFSKVLDIMRRHPLVLFYIGGAAGLISGWFGAKEKDTHLLIGLGILWLTSWLLVLILDHKKVGIWLLAASMASTPLMAGEEPPKPLLEPFQAAGAPIGLGIGLGLLIGSGYVAVRVIRACAKRGKFPTNSPPSEVRGAESPSYAGQVLYENDYCGFEAAADTLSQNGFSLEAEVWLDDTFEPQIRLHDARHVPAAGLVDFDTWNAQLGQWGVTYDGKEGQTYARNGQPCSSSEVPFGFGPPWAPSILLFPGRELFHVELSASRNLEDWTNMVDLWLPAGVPVKILDNPPGDQAFYRVTIVP